jgi:biopolymer transport protein ExbB
MTLSLSSIVTLVLANTAAPHGGGGMDGLVKFFKDGGPFMYVNIFWLAFALAVIVERIYTLVFRYSLNAPVFMAQITKLVKSGNKERAAKLCAAVPNAPLARVLQAALAHADRGEMDVARAVEEAVMEHTPVITHRIGWLWSLANIATLVGLVGTIIGLIGTFQSLGNVPADQKQALLSAGISEAMNNTAFGLGIAVTCIVFHLFLTAYSKGMLETIELSAVKLENLIARSSGEDPGEGHSGMSRSA